ncbi:hypothetical protein HNQ72_004351 [Rhizobium wenxiniae]|uniref:Uncharacterized protein n=1 Tax=Rhizobium wenxiniae TaxID=1737357 RepID=A0A7W9Y9K3_9HYPH|nr:hypothetical protein [Rhizobium wenxiniae]MBB6164506.1 hypothetical protein [Rhizobium wenxiniae]
MAVDLTAGVDTVHRFCGDLFNWDLEKNVRIARQRLKRSFDQVIFLRAGEMVSRGVAAQQHSQCAHVARGKTPAPSVHVFLPDLTGLESRPISAASIIPISPEIISKVSDIKKPAQMQAAVVW